MRNYLEMTKQASAIVDNEGCLLKIFGGKSIENTLTKGNFLEGSVWNENSVGTSAISLCVHLEKAITVCGFEHFIYGAINSCCYASPIFSREGSLAGVLSITSQDHKPSISTLGMVTSMAMTIEQELMLQSINSGPTSSEIFLTGFLDQMKIGIVVVSGRSYVITDCNDRIAHQLGYERKNLIGSSLIEILPYEKNQEFWQQLISPFPKERMFNLFTQSKFMLFNIKFHKRSVDEFIITFEKDTHKYTVKSTSKNITFGSIIGENQSLKRSLGIAKRVADTDCNLLITGETGTGKDMLAEAVHRESYRHSKPYVVINCANIPKDLVESELFGYEEGAFTGARKGGKKGKFFAAEGGTLFLDEIGDMPINLQAKLLRAIEKKLILPIGGNQEIPIDVRVIAATNKDLDLAIKNGEFRADLKYRLEMLTISLPPLRERKEDIITLFKFFTEELCANLKIDPPMIEPSALQCLMLYNWPGNIRELKNIAHRCIYTMENDIISTCQLPDHLVIHRNYGEVMAADSKEVGLSHTLEKSLILNLLNLYNGDKSKVAADMGISLSTIYRKIKKFGY